MTTFAASSLRALRRLLLAPTSSRAEPGPVVMDGLSAVAFVEASIADGATLGASWPASTGARLWRRRCAHAALNRFGRALASVETGSPRGALAAAVGLAAAGDRATTFLSGPDCLAAQDILAQAAGLHVPLVVHVAARAAAGHAQAIGSGHEALHAAADRGWFVLTATNVQEAVDLALIARRVTERSLVPGIVAMDGEQTALAAQDVHLPDAALLADFVGDPAAPVEPADDVQKILYGATRRRVPRGFDVERPVLRGSYQGPERWGLGAAAGAVYFDALLEGELGRAVEEFRARTGRDLDGLRRDGTDDARIVLVAQGAAVETAIAVASWMRRVEKTRVGVAGVRHLRPFPRVALAAALRDAHVVAVLERVAGPPGGDGPLAREVRCALDHERGEHATFRKKDGPRIVNVPCGLGGLPVRVADLVALVRELAAPHRPTVYLGLDFVRSNSAYPKREALMDTLRRARPDVAALGLHAAADPPDVRPEGAVTIALHRLAGADETLAGAAATLVHEAAGGFLRTRPGLAWPRSGMPCRDVLTFASSPLGDPGDDVGIDLAIIAEPRLATRVDPATRLATGGALLVVTEASEDAAVTLPGAVRDAIRAKGVAVHAVRMAPAHGEVALDADARRAEAVLAGLLALFASKTGRSIPPERARSLRAASLDEDATEESERRLDAFGASYAAVTRIDDANVREAALASSEPFVPPALRDLDRADGTIGCLSSFWDRTGILYRTGATDELTADPHAAMGAVPALTSSFRDAGDACDRIPVLDPASCDGDPRLWTTCPDGSVAAIAIAPRALIDTGIDLAARAGHAADALRSVAPRLARQVARAASQRPAATSAADLLRAGFDAMAAKGDLSADRRAGLTAALDGVVAAVGALLLVRTAALFDEPEAAAAGTGELLTLAVNPDACRCPDLLIRRCGGHGIATAPRTPGAVAAARAQWELFWQLPDTSGATIARARAHPAIGPLAGLMLSRHCAQAMAAGDGAEPGSGASLVLRHVLAISEFHVGPRLQTHLDDIEQLRRKLAGCIQAALATALPTEDLDALAEGLDVLGRREVGLTALSARVDAAVEGGRVDGARLGRLVDAARALADLHWRVSRGADGRGRARAGMVLAADSTGAGSGVYPHNPFACPVIIDSSGETADFARGLLEGHLRHLIAGFRARRWAQRLVEDSDAATPPDLHFHELTEEERAVCPPILLVGDGRSLGVRGLASLTWLLRSGLPVKVLVLNGIGGAVAGDRGVDAFGAYPDRQPFDLGLLAVLGREAFVVQTSPARPDHLADGVLAAMRFDGPALVHVHAPSPERDGFPAERLFAQAETAVATRAFPVFTFDPQREGVFGAKLSLAGNPAPDADRAPDAAGGFLTLADWYASETRFAAHLAPGADGRPAPDAALASDAEERSRLWRTLQELAGIVTPFTATVRADVERDVADAHQADVQTLRDAYEAKLANLRGDFEREAADRVTAGLMALAGYGTSGADGETSP